MVLCDIHCDLTFFVGDQTPIVRDELTVVLTDSVLTLNHVDSCDYMVVDDHRAGGMEYVL